jgi:CheY-like chemotaxis protein/signal transduction histidine kinase
MKLWDLPILKNCNSNSIVIKYRNLAFIILSCIFLLYGTGILIYSIVNIEIVNSIIFSITILLLGINLFFFFRLNHSAIWKYILVALISIIVVIQSSSITSSNFSSLIIITIPLIAYSICDRKNASIITIFFFLLNLIVFIQKLFLNYYNPESFIISFYILVLYTIIGGLTMLLSFIDFKKESHYENKVIVEKNTNITNTEIIKKFNHELRTAINNISAISDILSETYKNPDQLEYFDTINTSINSILTATKKLDIFSTTQKNKQESEKQSFDIANTVHDFLKIYSHNKKEKQYYFTFSSTKSISKNLIGIPEKLKQILFNIFETISSNTESYKVDIDVSISTKKETNETTDILLEIHTTSIQINALEVELDKNYSRLHNYFSNRSIEIPDEDDKEYEENYSIILAKNIVKHLNGEIGIKFKDPNIVIFWMTLPLWKKDVIETKPKIEQEITPKEPQKESKLLSDIKILVVEDNHLNQRVLVLGLKNYVKAIDIANNGKEAIDMFSNSKYDLILMDLHLPILDGFKATEKIRELEVGLNTHIPIIGLSAILMDGIKEQCIKAGLDEYLSKPYNISKLKERMHYFINL